MPIKSVFLAKLFQRQRQKRGPNDKVVMRQTFFFVGKIFFLDLAATERNWLQSVEWRTKVVRSRTKEVLLDANGFI